MAIHPEQSGGICFDIDALDIYTVEVDGKPFLAFPAETRAVVDDRMETLDGLEEFLGYLEDPQPFEPPWDGDRSRLHARDATEAERETWKAGVRDMIRKSPNQAVDVVWLVPAPYLTDDPPGPTEVTYH